MEWDQRPSSRKSQYLYWPEIKYSNRNIKNKSLGQQTTPLCFINWQFYRVRSKTIETLIIGTFEKQAPVPIYRNFTQVGT